MNVASQVIALSGGCAKLRLFGTSGRLEY